MKKVLFIITTAALSLATTIAFAAGTVTKDGANYSGVRNPDGCEIMPDGEGMRALHVKCTSKVGADGPAFVRYRFLKDVGGVRDAATISADITTWVGNECFAEWMVKAPKTAARTLRVTVPFGSYCHINSVSWTQP
jgi:hypothetical protein